MMEKFDIADLREHHSLEVLKAILRHIDLELVSSEPVIGSRVFRILRPNEKLK